jgi:hypothetical protein
LRRALLTRDQLAVLLLHWRFQPPLDVENHPLFLGVFLYRPYQWGITKSSFPEPRAKHQGACSETDTATRFRPGRCEIEAGSASD